MKISSAFPSNYVRAADLDGREVTVTISRVKEETIGNDGEKRPVVYFEGKDKGMILNVTNSKTISSLYGDETNDWEGEQITLFPAMVAFKGETVPAIRVKQPSRKATGKAKAKPAAPPPPDVDEGDSGSDGIPF